MFPTKRAEMALLVRTSELLPEDDCFPQPLPNQAGRGGAVGQGFVYVLSSVKNLAKFFPKKYVPTRRARVALLVRTASSQIFDVLEPTCFPNQTGTGGAVGRDFRARLPSVKILSNSFESVCPNQSGRVALLVRISLLPCLLEWNLPGAFTSFF